MEISDRDDRNPFQDDEQDDEGRFTQPTWTDRQQQENETSSSVPETPAPTRTDNRLAAPATPFTQRIVYDALLTPAAGPKASSNTKNHTGSAKDGKLPKYRRRTTRCLFRCCDVIYYVVRPFTTAYIWMVNAFVFLLFLRYLIITYGGVVSYACGMPIIHTFLCPSRSLLPDIVDDMPYSVITSHITSISPVSPDLDTNAPTITSFGTVATSATFGQVVEEIETIALKMLSLVRRSSSPRKSEMSTILEEIVKLAGIMGPGAFAYHQGMTRSADDIASFGQINFDDSGSGPAHAENANGAPFGAGNLLADNLDDLSNEGERQIAGAGRMKERISALIAIVQEELADAEQGAIAISKSTWTWLGGNQGLLKRLRFWLKLLKKLETLSETILKHTTNLKSHYASSNAEVSDLHHRVKGLFTENGMPFRAKWLSVQAAVLRMWQGGAAPQDRARAIAGGMAAD